VSRLFASLYFDEDVSVLVAKLVRSRGFSTLSSVEAGRLGSSDLEQLEFATQRQMAIVTHNRVHFELLARDWHSTGRKHCGIILAVRRTPYEIVRRLLPFLNRLTADELDNQAIYI
jgi:hypothetical protein